MMPEWMGTDEELEAEMLDGWAAMQQQEPEDWDRGMGDEVHHPEHYTAGGIEVLDLIKAKLTPEEFRGYLKGNILKYICRSNFKGKHDTDIGKTCFYAEELLDATQETET